MRFGLKLIFAATAIVALACAAMFSFPPLPGLLTQMAITSMMHAGCVAWIIWGKCYQRAFAIGYSVSFIPAVILMTYGAIVVAEAGTNVPVTTALVGGDDATRLRIYFAEIWGFSLLCGLAAIAGRWLGMSNRVLSKTNSDSPLQGSS